MATIDLGKVRITPKGEWNSSATYEILDVVSLDGSSYLAIGAVSANTAVTNATYWAILASKGETGSTGLTGNTGSVAPDTFESLAKNLSAYPSVLGYIGANLATVTYSISGGEEIVKTLNYTSGNLTSIVLSGDTPAGIDLTKTLSYTGSNLTGVSYS